MGLIIAKMVDRELDTITWMSSIDDDIDSIPLTNEEDSSTDTMAITTPSQD